MTHRFNPDALRGWIIAAAVMSATATPTLVLAQQSRSTGGSTDTVTVVAGPRYDKPALYRSLFGGSYRELWLTPIRVPVLNLRTFDGGLVADELGGGNATLSLRLDSEDGSRYVFRTVDKEPKVLPPVAQGGFPRDVARDRTASTHPAANLAHAPFYAAVGVIHDDDAQLFVLPDDERLGEWRELMAGRLGVLTSFPGKKPQQMAEYGGAIEIAESDSVLQLLNQDPRERVEPTQYILARFMDMLLNNWDRHPGNWEWARLSQGGAWQPISRDMDNVFVSQDGFLPGLAKAASPKILTFDSTFPAMSSLIYKGGILDRRILMGTSRAVFDSMARIARSRITDAVIAASMARMPVEYASSHPELMAKLRMRRDSIPAVAERWYLWINRVADIHATDAADRATVTRLDPNTVAVRLEGSDGRSYFDRRFDTRETSEIRLYLHGGDDRATVVGDVPSSLPVRIIGGNGNNQMVDSSRVGGQTGAARLYDVGPTDDVEYGVDTVWNRRALVSGGRIPGRDYGRGIMPIVGLGTNRDHGITPKLGMAWYTYGFRKEPYASRVALDGRYSFRNEGFAFALNVDRRVEDSRLHYTLLARMSQIDLLNYHGLGNSTPPSPGVAVGDQAERNTLYSVNQDQWVLHPTVAYALGEKSDLSLGPVMQYSINNGTPGGFLETTAPYGSGEFGQAGLRASLTHDTRDRSSHPRSGLLLEARGDYFPAVWDVQDPFSAVRATAGVYVTLPVPLKPYLGLRVIGQKVFGEFPFHEAAFIGGRGGVRSLDLQRFAGDAALTGKLELRVPVVTVNFILPIEMGVFAAQEIGRVYVDGASPGGWHDTFGAGLWLAFQDISISFRFVEKNEVLRDAEPALSIGASVGIP
jgi:hypothetical protein